MNIKLLLVASLVSISVTVTNASIVLGKFRGEKSDDAKIIV